MKNPTITARTTQKSHETGNYPESESIKTGIRKLDEATLGLRPRDLIIISGYTSVGKTALAILLAIRGASQEKIDGTKDPKTVLFVSFEMSAEQIVGRMTSYIAANLPPNIATIIDSRHVRNPRIINDDKIETFNEAIKRGRHMPIVISDGPMNLYLNINTLRDKASRVASESRSKGVPLGMVVVDCLQHLKGDPDTFREGKYTLADKIKSVSNELKQLALDLNVPVVAISQINRNVTLRQSNEPNIDDLQGGRAIAENADVVLFLEGEGQYGGPPIPSPANGRPHLVKILVCKNLHGGAGFKINMNFYPTRNDFIPEDEQPRELPERPPIADRLHPKKDVKA